MNGGCVPTRAIDGYYLAILAHYRRIHPTAYNYEARAELARITGVVFSIHAIKSAQTDDMNLSYTRNSTAASQAFTPANQHRLHCFQTMPPPLGVVGVPTAHLWDIDEIGRNLSHFNRAYGHSIVGGRTVEKGNYTRSSSTTVMLAVRGDGEKFVMLFEGGVGYEECERFFEQLVTQLAAIPNLPPQVFMMDNLHAHHSPMIYNTVHNAGHTLVFRPPYMPWLAPIEYVFSQVTQLVAKQSFSVSSSQDVNGALRKAVREVSGIPATFVKLGY